MKLWEIFVPCQANDGTPFRTRHHREWDRQVREVSGGLTVMKPATGQWIDRVRGARLGRCQQLYTERVIPVRIACTEDEIEQIMDRTSKHYNQIAVMAYLVSDTVKIKHYE